MVADLIGLQAYADFYLKKFE